jgi:hypothetical protein
VLIHDPAIQRKPLYDLYAQGQTDAMNAEAPGKQGRKSPALNETGGC